MNTKKGPSHKETVKCSKCGKPDCGQGANYCTNCGSQLKDLGVIKPSLKYANSEPQQSQ